MSSSGSNRLIREKSPYLLQHAHNPVDWYPWGDEAIGLARSASKPIFLSVGYSTCYWCHVMERQVFENPAIAETLNKICVCIKVDREERPDIDRVYMTALQAMTGSGGWPMSLFLTPALEPFFAGTYIPPRSQGGRAGFTDIVTRIGEVWESDRDAILKSARDITQFLIAGTEKHAGELPAPELFNKAFETVAATFDPVHAGFGGGPKFPRPVTLLFLLRHYARTRRSDTLQMAVATMHAMNRGGMYDHLGGGYHRYSVDRQWRVPHFEKMLYDQAQLVVAGLEVHQILRPDGNDVTIGTQDDMAESGIRENDIVMRVRETLGYVMTRLRHPEGGFYSAEDAESIPHDAPASPKQEGSCYLWTADEITSILGKGDADIFGFVYGIEPGGNITADPHGVFTGKNILYLAHTPEETAATFGMGSSAVRSLLTAARLKLLAARDQRPPPVCDDKIITAWNGLAISAFSRAGFILNEPEYLAAARTAAEFVLTKCSDPRTGRLFRRYRDGEARFDGTLQDYAFLIGGLMDLFEASSEVRWLEHALRLTALQQELFTDTRDGGFFDTAGTDPTIILRTKEDYDGAEPSGNSAAALNLFRLAFLTESSALRSAAESVIRTFGSTLSRNPESMIGMFRALDWSFAKPVMIVIVGPESDPATIGFLNMVRRRFIPTGVVLRTDGSDLHQELRRHLRFLDTMPMKNGQPTVYRCEEYACHLPVTSPEELEKLLKPMP